MKSGIAAILFSSVSLILSIYLFVQVKSLREEKEISQQQNERQPLTNATGEEKEDVEMVHYMQRIQSFHAKLFYAGEQNNSLLARFYAEEIKEEMEIIAEAEIFDEGINISENMKLWGIRNINHFLDEIETPQFNFRNAFTNLTNACNSCHQATKHSFIQITEPTVPSYFNQEFKPVK